MAEGAVYSVYAYKNDVTVILQVYVGCIDIITYVVMTRCHVGGII